MHARTLLILYHRDGKTCTAMLRNEATNAATLWDVHAISSLRVSQFLNWAKKYTTPAKSIYGLITIVSTFSDAAAAIFDSCSM